MNCQGCGVEFDPTEEQVNASVDQVLEASLADAKRTRGVCPLCGHGQEIPWWRSKAANLGFAAAIVLAVAGFGVAFYAYRATQRAAAANDAVVRMNTNTALTNLLGSPIKSESVTGDVKQDETGWKEAKLTLHIRGPKGQGIAHVVGGRGSGPWVFTTFEVILEQQHKKLDLVAGSIVEYDQDAYVDVHTEAAVDPVYLTSSVAPPRWDGNVPCVFAVVNGSKTVPQIGQCPMPTERTGKVDRFEVDLRYGAFILRQTDLYLNDVFEVPLTRTYASDDWVALNRVHAFGIDANHPYDIAPLGSRNPYTFQLIAFEDSNFAYFDRISKGTGYADAVFQHSETSTKYYKSVTRWNGNGWTTKLADGSEIDFPESYHAINMAQGAPTEMRDAKGNRLLLKRDPQRNLLQILTPNTHWIKFDNDDRTRILRAYDDAGNWAKYDYNSDGMLSDVSFSSGHERHYSYNGTAMVEVRDETGKVLVHNWYDNRMVIQQEFADGSACAYRYRYAEKARYPFAVDVTLMSPAPSAKRTTTEVKVSDAIPEYVKSFQDRWTPTR
ncbi:MAG TPA: cytochrome c oxidase assembly factor Coa1 family protein [Terriglobales bacterium]|nr:cytochrome c oxidase assembly factor Coa1 family protein [Terriglobales bacterium]